MKNNQIVIEREVLYEKIWSTPMSRLASEYGISDVGLQKSVCASKNSEVKVASRNSETSHARTLLLAFYDGDTYEIDFDQGMGLGDIMEVAVGTAMKLMILKLN